MEDKKMGMLVAREDPISIGVLLFPPPPPSVQTKLQPTFQTLQTLFLEKNNTMVKRA